MILKISEEYTETPGARYISDGPYSGEEFRDKILIKKLEECIKSKSKLIIDLDGGYGYSTGFLEEAFGGLIRLGFTKDQLLNTISFISNDEPNLTYEIISYIIEESERQKSDKKQLTIN